MTLHKLEEKVSESGTAHAIVVLNREKMAGDSRESAANETATLAAKAKGPGRISRQSPQVSQQRLTDLADNFHPVLPYPSKNEMPVMQYFPMLGIAYGRVNQKTLSTLEKHVAVEEIHHSPELELIRPHSTGSVQANPPGKIDWGIERMLAPQLWERGLTGEGILVAHLDTGADSKHPALKNAVKESMVFDEQGPVAKKQQSACVDSGCHGTHTASIIAGRTVPGKPLVGMAPGALLACGTVIEGGNTVARLLAGLEWALGTGARILNLSLGFREWDSSFTHIIRTLREHQMLPVAAIGNEGEHKSRSPGNYADVLSVGACSDKNLVLPFSGSENHDQFSGPVLCAPGLDILGATDSGKYQAVSGTSEATPLISGLAALLVQAKPDATIDQVQQAIIASCENPADVDSVRIGAGIPNSLAALKYLMQS